ncbi:hypothetical protein AB9F29_02330 [Falsihalocynthiibacter sp. S25ZX9]|uniref:hypothetical protein n=1 Tax=Falsihalocynthiibacter sp. S25ZX9 TaxID=3240870 RepID=UPI0035106711
MFVKRSLAIGALLLFITAFASSVFAERASLFRVSTLPQSSGSLFELSSLTSGLDEPLSTASLFAGRRATSLFAPYSVKENKIEREVQLSKYALQATGIRHVIGQAEAGKKGYDAIQHGARLRPAKKPTDMTLAEIFDWIEQTPNQNHAIGRYQFIPATLQRLVDFLGVNERAVFSAEVQDQLADVLLVEAGLNAFSEGEIERHDFMHNMAKIWAGLPTSTGKSFYNGYAGNKATMTWAHFDREMAKIFPS